MDFTEALGRALRAERAAEFLTQRQVAERAGVSDMLLGAIERGRTADAVTYAQVESIASAIGCDLIYIHARAAMIMGRADGRINARDVMATGLNAGDQSAGDGSVQVAGATVYGDVVVQAPGDGDGE